MSMVKCTEIVSKWIPDIKKRKAHDEIERVILGQMGSSNKNALFLTAIT